MRFAAQEAACHPRRHRVDDYSAPNRWLHFFRSTLPTGNLSLFDQEERLCDSGTRKDVFMTALVDLRRAIRNELLVQQLAQWRFHFAGPSILSRAECSTHTL